MDYPYLGNTCKGVDKAPMGKGMVEHLPSFLLERCGITSLATLEVVGMGIGYYPGDLKALQVEKSGEKGQQATINDGRVTLQPVQRRKNSLATGISRTYTPIASGSNYGKQRTIISYNCKGEGHMSKQCTKPKRKRNDSWFKDKVLLVQAQANGQLLHEEELAFLADPRIVEDALTEVHNPGNIDNNMINQGVQARLFYEQENSVSNQSALSFDQYFELNELKAQSQEKDTVISKLKERIKYLSGNMNKDKVKKEIEEIETINIELDHRVSKLIA
nr:hypothetical protein [Tanacetum cinerariifolium]